MPLSAAQILYPGPLLTREGPEAAPDGGTCRGHHKAHRHVADRLASAATVGPHGSGDRGSLLILNSGLASGSGTERFAGRVP